MSPIHKYKILLDEGLPPRKKLPRVNARHNVKHIRDDLNHTGLPDEKVYKEAEKLERILVVFNVKHFKEFAAKSSKTGIIGISQSMSLDNLDKKLNALLVRSKPSDLLGKFNYISGESD
jgi:hypothetical protein